MMSAARRGVKEDSVLDQSSKKEKEKGKKKKRKKKKKGLSLRAELLCSGEGAGSSMTLKRDLERLPRTWCACGQSLRMYHLRV
jgi:hypothetical protein